MILVNSGNKYIYAIGIFLLIFNPPLFPGISFTTIFAIISFLYCVVNINCILRWGRKRCVKVFFIFFMLYIVYAVLIGGINALGSDMASTIGDNLQGIIVENISIIAVSLGTIIFFTKRSYTFDDILDVYVIAGTFQGCIAVLCLVSPSIKSYFNTLMMNNSGAEKIARTLMYTSEFRNFGFASTLYDIFGLTMSMLAILALYQAIKGDKVRFVSFGLMALTACLNARTSIILLAIGVVVIVATAGKNSTRNIPKIILFLVVFVSGVLLIRSVIGNLDSVSLFYTWFKDGFNQIMDLVFEHKTTGYFDTLFNQFLFLPDDITSVLFGTSCLPEQIIRNTDVGYIRNIWQYGILGSIILYGSYFYLFRNAKTLAIGIEKSILDGFLLFIIIYLVKLNCLGYSMAAVIYLPLVLFEITEGENIKMSRMSYSTRSERNQGYEHINNRGQFH